MQAITLLLAAAGVAEAYTTVKVKAFMNKNIDSLVIPGQYKSHLHTFLGKLCGKSYDKCTRKTCIHSRHSSEYKCIYTILIPVGQDRML